jgi:hypothetical protein
MKTKDILTITTVALGTATLTVAAFWAGPIEAGSEGDAPPAKIGQSRLVTQGVAMTLAPAEGRVFKAGDQPQFELTAVNTTQQPASASVQVTMTSFSMASMASRVGPRPNVLWKRDQIVNLKPNETKAINLGASTNLPPNSVISVSLGEPNPTSARRGTGIEALSFSTVAPKAVPTVASVR